MSNKVSFVESVNFFKKVLDKKEFEGNEIKEVHMRTLNPGDAILCSDGKIRTVCKKDIAYDAFMGYSVFGKSYMSGYQQAVKIVYPRWTKGEKNR